MSIIKKFIVVLLLIILQQVLMIPILSGQKYTLQKFTTKDGLANNNIRTIARDSSGFLWIGTWDGLSRFDGHEFKNYYHIPGDINSLPYFSVKSICVDGTNNIWILTDYNQIVRLNSITDQFETIPVFSNSLSTTLCMSIDTVGNLWILSQDRM